MIISCRVPDDLVLKIDDVAGSAKRSVFIRCAIEAAFEGRVFRYSDDEVFAAAPKAVRVERKRVAAAVVADTEKRIDAIASGRDAVPVKKNLDVVSAPKGHPDDELYLVQLRRMKRPSERDISLALNWQGLRASKAFGRLLKAGRIRVLGGAVQEVML